MKTIASGVQKRTESFFFAAAIVLLTSFSGPCQTHPTLDSTVICGYQGWFGTPGDGGYNGWGHWNTSSNPGFEIYPDISEYPAAELYQTGYAALGDGRPAKLFSSYRANTTDLHFKWMQENGIDGAALQRFLNEIPNASLKRVRDSVAVHMMRAAEKYNRIFYIMYDGVADNMSTLENDWQNTIVNGLKLTSSPRYAYMNGKPVVCIWGFGLNGYSDNATDALAAVNWFKNNGCYVIGGVPGGWASGTGDSKAGYSQVYAAYDMISPWSVGAYKSNADVDNALKNRLIPEKTALDAQGRAYQPVMFPGFAWSHLHNGPRNDFPRRQGNFLWRQFYNFKSIGIKYVYLAMFDESDEGTAITKSASDYFDTPTNVYFQTMSIDSVYISSDFYLRLVGAAAKALKSSSQVTLAVPVPNSIGPIFFRSSFEPACDAQLTWTNSADTLAGSIQNVTGTQCAVTSGTAASGTYAVKYAGNASSTSRATARFRVISANWISVDSQMTLSFAFNPQNSLGRFACVDLAASDGTLLSASGATDTQGISMAPSAGRGVVNQWTTVKCKIGRWLYGKKIDRILVSYDHAGDLGSFSGYIDNVAIQSASSVIGVGVQANRSIVARENSENFVRYNKGVLWIGGPPKEFAGQIRVSVYDPAGMLVFHKTCAVGRIPVGLRPGKYFAKIEKSGNAVPVVVGLLISN